MAGYSSPDFPRQFFLCYKNLCKLDYATNQAAASTEEICGVLFYDEEGLALRMTEEEKYVTINEDICSHITVPPIIEEKNDIIASHNSDSATSSNGTKYLPISERSPFEKDYEYLIKKNGASYSTTRVYTTTVL